MDNKFENFNRAKDEIQKNIKTTIVPEIEKKQTYSFTLLPSERQMLKELAEQTHIRVSDSQFLGNLIREYYEENKLKSR